MSPRAAQKKKIDNVIGGRIVFLCRLDDHQEFPFRATPPGCRASQIVPRMQTDGWFVKLKGPRANSRPSWPPIDPCDSPPLNVFAERRARDNRADFFHTEQPRRISE